MKRTLGTVAAAMLLCAFGAAGARAEVCVEPLCVGPVDFPLIPSLPLPVGARPPSITAPPPGCDDVSLAMKILVLSADGSEAVLPAITQALDYHSIPYETYIASQHPGELTPARLGSGCTGNYQGVALTTGALSYSPDGGQTF